MSNKFKESDTKNGKYYFFHNMSISKSLIQIKSRYIKSHTKIF